MHEPISTLLQTIVTQFIMAESLVAQKLDDTSNFIPVNMIECGTGVREAMATASVSSVVVATFLVKDRSAYVSSTHFIWTAEVVKEKMHF